MKAQLSNRTTWSTTRWRKDRVVHFLNTRFSARRGKPRKARVPWPIIASREGQDWFTIAKADVRGQCWKYALEAIIKWLLLYFLVHDNCLLFML